jgi:hypothetical protein
MFTVPDKCLVTVSNNFDSTQLQLLSVTALCVMMVFCFQLRMITETLSNR